MAKRLSYRALRATRSYDIEEVATALGVSQGTIRAWVKQGLPIMKSQRPYLILGENLKAFLRERAKSRRVKLEPSELYCLTCKAARTPYGMLVDFIPQTATSARLMGLCDVCGGTCNRMISRSKIGQFCEIFEVAMKDGQTA